MTDSLILLDLKGNIVSLNRAALDLLAYDGNELEGRPVTCIFAESESNTDLINKCINGTTLKDYEISLKTKGGEKP